MACPWAKINQQETVSFVQIMSEQIKNLKARNSHENQFEIFKSQESTNHIRSKVPVNVIEDVLDKRLSISQDFVDDSRVLVHKDCENDIMEAITNIFDAEVGSIKFDNSEKIPTKHKSVTNSRNDFEQFNKVKSNSKKDQVISRYCNDQITDILLNKLIETRVIKRINGVISHGKKPTLFHATANTFPHMSEHSEECVVKLFKTTLSKHKQGNNYLKNIQHFRSKKNTSTEAEKEMAIFMKLQDANVDCPKIVALKMGVLITSFIGENHRSAPKLIHAPLTSDVCWDKDEYYLAYSEVILTLQKMFTAKIIHGELLKHILWYNRRCYIVHVDQCVHKSHKLAYSLLFNDCSSIVNFFSNKILSIPYVMRTPNELFYMILGEEFSNERFYLKPRIDRRGIHTLNKPNRK